MDHKLPVFRAIGIDPGSRFTGFGIVEGDGNRLRHVMNGTVRIPPQLSFPDRLKMIYEQLTCVICDVRPDCMAVEDVFFAKNVKSALKLGQARGAAILAGANAGLIVYEYSALQIKQAVVGYGKAGKDQVGEMIGYLFGLRDELEPNAADALAVAVCHLNTHASKVRWNLPGVL
jgi:crossover junction endodeoxyribonuclease RuvC